MKIVVIGANGQLGADLVVEFSKDSETHALTHQDIEITDLQQSRRVLGDIQPDYVFNTAASHNVPNCEQDPVTAFAVNGQGALHLARLSRELDFTLLHYSTDYVFDGQKLAPYTEEDCPNPLNVYAATKLSGEQFIRHYSEKYFILRVAGIYGKTPCRAKGGNFIDTMVRLAAEKPKVTVVDDEILTPTSTRQIASNSRLLLDSDAYGLYHMTAAGSVSWYQFARVIFDELGLQTPLESCSVTDFPSPVKRPTYSVLENRGLKKIGLDQMAHWKEALLEYLHGDFKLKS